MFKPKILHHRAPKQLETCTPASANARHHHTAVAESPLISGQPKTARRFRNARALHTSSWRHVARKIAAMQGCAVPPFTATTAPAYVHGFRANHRFSPLVVPIAHVARAKAAKEKENMAARMPITSSVANPASVIELPTTTSPDDQTTPCCDIIFARRPPLLPTPPFKTKPPPVRGPFCVFSF